MFRWARRDDHSLATTVGVATISVFAARLASSVPIEGASALLETIVWTPLFAASIFALHYAIAVPLPSTASRRVPLAIASTVALLAAAVDAYAGRVLGRHLSASEIALAADAIRTRNINVSIGDSLALAAAVVLLGALVWAFFGLLTRIPRLSERRARALDHSLLGLASLLFVAITFRELLFPQGSAILRILTRHAGDTLARASERAEDELQIGPGLLRAQLEKLHFIADHLGSLDVSARSRPDILFVHVESLRYDVFIDVLMPETYKRRARCVASDRHYSTGNATGSSLFGVITGLSAAYTELFRQARLEPIPLSVLRALGYRTQVWFPKDALRYDNHTPDVLGPSVEAHSFEGEPTHVADAATNEALLADLSAHPGPRFDYLVIDSTHYDYSYPPEFELLKPAEPLGYRFDSRTGQFFGGSADPISTERRASVFNRYKNATRFIDTLVARWIDRSSPERLVVVFGDHGEAFWDAGLGFGHQSTLIDAQTRVPLLVCGGPGIPGGVALSSHADIFPTLFDWMGLRSRAAFMTGRSLSRPDPDGGAALLRMPVTSVSASPVYAVVHGDYKVGFLARDPPVITWVWGRDDRPMAEPDPASVRRIMMLGALANTLRSPSESAAAGP